MTAATRKTVTEITIHVQNESPVYSATRTVIRMDDEGAGPYLRIEQPESVADGAITLTREELHDVCAAAEVLLMQVADLEIENDAAN